MRAPLLQPSPSSPLTAKLVTDDADAAARGPPVPKKCAAASGSVRVASKTSMPRVGTGGGTSGTSGDVSAEAATSSAAASASIR